MSLILKHDTAVKYVPENLYPREHGIPFELKLEVPNDTTAAAIEEGRKMMKDPSASRYFQYGCAQGSSRCMKYDIQFTNQFKKDLKLAKKQKQKS